MGTSKWTYLRTHPWITFTAQKQIQAAPPKLWMLLGEATSRCDHVASLPLKPGLSSRLGELYLAKGMHGTTAIEGNPLTENQVRQHIEGQLELPASQQYHQQEVDNVLRACAEINKDELHEKNPQITPALVCQFNRGVLDDLDLPPEVVPGKIRKHSVEVMRYLAPPPAECEHLLQRFSDWMNSNDFAPDEDKGPAVAVLKAVLAHLYLAWIHPFGDGNGRTARLLEYYILIHAGVPNLSAHLFSNHYMLTRDKYIKELSTASKSDRGIVPFLLYAVSGFVEQLTLQIREVQMQQWRVSWTDFVHESFRTKGSRAQRRRRDLLIDMPWAEHCSRQEIRHVSPRVAEAYAGKTDKTVTRDINALLDSGLLERGSKGGYQPKWQLMLGFLPLRRRFDLEITPPSAT